VRSRHLLLIAAGLVLTPALAFAAPSEANFLASCGACHQPTGMGIPGAFPALAGNAFVQGPAGPVISTVLGGRGGMPAFKGDLDDANLASVLSYIRTAWGNKASLVEPADIAAVRTGAAGPADKAIGAPH
jgi:mono/diheme cytochrome c family protein